MSPLDRRIERLFLRLDAIALWRAIALLTALCLGAGVALALLVAWPLHASGLDPRLSSPARLLAGGPAKALLWGVALMPLVETWVSQAFPVFLARHVTGRPAPIIAFTTLAFAGAHALFSNAAHGLTTLGSGAVLGFTYFWASRRAPRPRPVLVTYAVHALNNLVALGVTLLLLR